MCAAVAGPVKPLNVTLGCSVCAVGANTTVTKPVPGEAVGGTSFAAERVVVNVIGTACAAGSENNISALLKLIAKTKRRGFIAISYSRLTPNSIFGLYRAANASHNQLNFGLVSKCL